MMQTDYENLAISLASLSGLPVRLYFDDTFTSLHHHTKFKPDLAILEEQRIFESRGNVSYYVDENFLCYGLFRAKADRAALLIGPVAQMRIDQGAVVRILRTIGERPERATELLNYFSAIPSYPLRNFLQILCTVNYFINGDKLEVSDLLLEEGAALLETPVQPPAELPEEAVVHNTMELERMLLSCVEHGRTDEIRALFRRPAVGRAGTMSGDALRQQKNLLICTATLVTRAAVRGGLDIETAFALSDVYIQKAELLNNYVALTRLNAEMVLDFTARVEALRCGVGDSKLLRAARGYILQHLDESVTTADLARALGRNRSYLCKLFVEQTGQTINRYVAGVKIDEARRLLEITKKTIAEISMQLGFSSQSYFQNVFKQHTGITPHAYRQQAGMNAR